MNANRQLNDFLIRNGYLRGMVLPDGRVAFINATVVGQGELGLSASLDDFDGVSDRYAYPSPQAALDALHVWAAAGFTGEPLAWHRHVPSMRRRPGGDPAREEVRP